MFVRPGRRHASHRANHEVARLPNLDSIGGDKNQSKPLAVARATFSASTGSGTSAETLALYPAAAIGRVATLAEDRGGIQGR